ncbi:hypothetical protein J437_LFUL011576 [Ladona fulva]|uniref:DisA/LigA helix-hairpin-helix motif domain-containing protein n=1 Tax=Ladona fulva TaxID=123851 RepID=A0A8K0KAX9_LADFU|nr:hypothetical protein J437_LFUL011576 [Ladona fulva]
MEYFSDLQKIAVIEYSLTIIPISSTLHMEDTIAHMIKCENRSPHNPFKFKKSKEEFHNEQAQQIAILSTIPGVREAKALRLLKAFGTITALSNASFKELSDVVGNAVAQSIVDFIHK